MAKVCYFTGRKTVSGNNRSRYEQTKRAVKPNLQKVTVLIDGKPKKFGLQLVHLKSGKVERVYEERRLGIKCPAFAFDRNSSMTQWLIAQSIALRGMGKLKGFGEPFSTFFILRSSFPPLFFSPETAVTAGEE